MCNRTCHAPPPPVPPRPARPGYEHCASAPPAGELGGPDVSHYQGTIDWPAVAATGAGFAIAKATEGTGYVDPMFAANWRGMHASGVRVRGAYHYGRPGDDAEAQARHLVSTVGLLRAGDFLALDIESDDGVGPAETAAWSVAFVTTAMAVSGLPPSRVVVYTGAWFWNSHAGGSAALGGHPLWISGYVKSAPPMPTGWSSWAFWQYTDAASLSGVSRGVDYSRFNGTRAQLEEMMGL